MSYGKHFDDIELFDDSVAFDYYTKAEYKGLRIKRGSTVTDLAVSIVQWTPLKVETFNKVIAMGAKSIVVSRSLDEEKYKKIPTTTEYTLLDFNGIPENAFADNAFPQFESNKLVIRNSMMKNLKFQPIEDMKEFELYCENEEHVLEASEIFKLFPETCIDCKCEGS